MSTQFLPIAAISVFHKQIKIIIFYNSGFARGMHIERSSAPPIFDILRCVCSFNELFRKPYISQKSASKFPFLRLCAHFFSVILIRCVISDCWSSPSVTNLAIWKDLLVASPTQRFCFLCVGSARTADRTCIHPSKLIFRLDVQQAVTHWQRRSQLPLSPFMQAKHHVSASTDLALQKDFVDKAVSVSEIFEHSE